MSIRLVAPILAIACSFVGCSDSDRRPVGTTTAPATSATTASASSAAMFEVRIQNVSDTSSLPTPLAPVGWVVHDGTVTLFTNGAPDRGEGLEVLAEDGDSSQLVASLATNLGVASSGNQAPVPPGGVETFTVDGEPGVASRLSLATMLVQSNDAFYSFDPGGVDLFDANGNPLPERTVAVTLWDAGTEANEVPGAGPNQPLRQRAPNTGPGEGVVRPFTDTTRGLPPANDLIDLTVSLTGGQFTIEVHNETARGGFASPLAPVFWAVHDATFRLFQEGQPVLLNGLESLAEDGSPMQLVGATAGDPLVDASGAAGITLQRPLDAPGPAQPGEQFRFSVTPTPTHSRLTFVAMLVETNDVFVGLGEQGVDLLDAAGNPRAASAVLGDLERELALWDAGTEANQTLGAGPSQPMRQAAANTGAFDPDNVVRRYADSANDLGPGFAAVTVVQGAAPMSFDVTVRNASDATSYTGVLTPVAYAVHAPTVSLFTPGQAASPGLERLAEDGNPAVLAAELRAVATEGVANTPVGAAAPGPIAAGGSYTFTVTASAAEPRLSLATMAVPSNDAFLAFEPAGLALLNAAGQRRTDAELAADVAALLRVWDAGSEANQVGAAGPDQPPRQAGPDTGGAEGDGTVRPFADSVWTYPRPDQVIRITIRPLP